jgi:hypothetical protein
MMTMATPTTTTAAPSSLVFLGFFFATTTPATPRLLVLAQPVLPLRSLDLFVTTTCTIFLFCFAIRFMPIVTLVFVCNALHCTAYYYLLVCRHDQLTLTTVLLIVSHQCSQRSILILYQ